ncbi:MAG: hypothetical protein ACRC8S_17370 [Fimbriiglobus sp.]
MRFFPKWHTPESVAQTLIDGLRNGSITLDGEVEDTKQTSPTQDAETPVVGPLELDFLNLARPIQTQSRPVDKT